MSWLGWLALLGGAGIARKWLPNLSRCVGVAFTSQHAVPFFLCCGPWQVLAALPLHVYTFFTSFHRFSGLCILQLSRAPVLLCRHPVHGAVCSSCITVHMYQ